MSNPKHKVKYKVTGKRVNLWIPGPQLKIAAQIDNLSSFLQIALGNAADIMAWAILRDIDPKKYHQIHKINKVVDEFNTKYPLDELTQKRQGTWRKPSVKLPEILS